jgi:gamma-glutamylcyclotransferase (GGCT)/AIG2-like uncharacterized protein YtfP
MPHVFVYGTLRRGSRNKFARLLHAHARFLDNARMPGRLYQPSHYPGAVLPDQPDDWVRGEVFQLDNPGILPALDEYEGPEFERTKVTVHLDTGEQIKPWVYLFTGKRRGRPIKSGDWFAA